MKKACYIIISIEGKIDNLLVERFFNKLFKNIEYSLSNIGDNYLLVIEDSGNNLGILQNSFLAAGEDLDVIIKGLIVPTYTPKFAYYLKFVENYKLKYLFEIAEFVPKFYNENLFLIENFDLYTLETVKAYIEANNSPLFASYKLYVHRNTVTYRVERFMQDTGVSLNSFANQVFIYFLISKRIALETQAV